MPVHLLSTVVYHYYIHKTYTCNSWHVNNTNTKQANRQQSKENTHTHTHTHTRQEMEFSGLLGPNFMTFADYLALLSHIQRQMQEKNRAAVNNSTPLGLNVCRAESNSQHNPHNTGWRCNRSDKFYRQTDANAKTFGPYLI